jgi:hypothetical protein
VNKLELVSKYLGQVIQDVHIISHVPISDLCLRLSRLIIFIYSSICCNRIKSQKDVSQEVVNHRRRYIHILTHPAGKTAKTRRCANRESNSGQLLGKLCCHYTIGAAVDDPESSENQ